MPESVPLNSPWPIFPTPEIADDLIIEIVDSENTEGQYTPLPVGTPHPNTRDYPGHKLVKQEAVSHNRVQRYWSTTYSNQDLYNYDKAFIAEHTSFPIYVRRYLVRRDQADAFEVSTVTPLTGVFLIAVTLAGSGYNPEVPPAVSFSGGGGAGATATAIVDSLGTVSWVRITSEGTGYTSAPTVTIAAPLSGTTATASATIQGNTTVLVSQKYQELPADDPRHSLFVLFTRIYKLLPGPEVYSYELRPDGNINRKSEQEVLATTVPVGGAGYLLDKVDGKSTREALRTREQLVQSDGSTPVGTDAGFTIPHYDHPTQALAGVTYRLREYGTALPEIGEVHLTGTIIDVKTKDIPGSTNVWQIIEWMELPDPWLEYPKAAVTFPGIFRFSPYAVDTDYGGQYPPPWPGDGVEEGTFYLLRPRSKEVQGRVINSFSLGPSGKAQQGYAVYTPGVASKIFRIPNDTVHGPIQATESFDGNTFNIENIPASTPGVYQSTQILTFPLGEERYKGNIYWNRILQVSEATNPYYFPDVYASSFFTFDSTSNGDLELEGQPNPGGERLSLVSDGADTRAVTIYGQRNNSDGIHYTKEVVNLTGTTRVYTSGTYDWFISTQVHVASDATRTLTVNGEGTDAEASITASGAPADGGTIEAGKTGSTVVYTLRNPGRATVLCPAGASLVTGASPASYVRIVYGVIDEYFWFSNGSTTDPAPGGTGHAVAFTGGDADTVIATNLLASIAANIPELHSSLATATITLTGIQLGVLTVTQDAGNDFTITTVAAGTAQVANQIRTGWSIAGVALTAANIATFIDQTFDLDGTAGETYSTATVAHPDLTASIDAGDTSTVILRSRLPQSYGTWVLTETSAALSVVAFTDGANGGLIASITPNETDAYNNFNTDNTTLVLTGAGWSPEDSNAYGAIVVNFPGQVGQLVSEAIHVDIPVGQTPVKLRLIAQGTPALPVDYQTSTDGISWSAGLTSLAAIGNSRLYDYDLAETSIEYIRIRITNNNVQARAIHAEVFTRVNIG